MKTLFAAASAALVVLSLNLSTPEDTPYLTREAATAGAFLTGVHGIDPSEASDLLHMYRSKIAGMIEEGRTGEEIARHIAGDLSATYEAPVPYIVSMRALEASALLAADLARTGWTGEEISRLVASYGPDLIANIEYGCTPEESAFNVLRAIEE